MPFINYRLHVDSVYNITLVFPACCTNNCQSVVVGVCRSELPISVEIAFSQKRILVVFDLDGENINR